MLGFTLTILAATLTPQTTTYDALYKDLKSKYESSFNGSTMQMGVWRPHVINAFKTIDFSKLTADEILSFYDVGLFFDLPGGDDDDEPRNKVVAQLKTRGESDTASLILKFALAAPGVTKETMPELERLWKLTTTDSATKDIMKSKHASVYLTTIVYFVPGTLYQNDSAAIARMAAALPDVWPSELAMLAETLSLDLFSEARVGKAANARAHKGAVASLEKARKEKENERWMPMLDSAYGRLTGKAAKGTLIGSPVTGVTVTWASDPKIKTIQDLKGKVVVLDFWATWCGPCIASFPELRNLKNEFKDSPVVVLGITSLQGRVSGLEERDISTDGQPEKEYELTKKFMQKHEITWPVAFTKEDVYNPTFGVGGIPYCAIIAPDGKVRYSNLSPNRDQKKIRGYVTDLLKEFKLAPFGQ